jgi:hypothetical protein
MPSYLERYENGEHAGVWDELRDIGADICTDADIRRDAEAVADATMQRAATNIATLAQRLSAMGYRFDGPHKVNLASGPYDGINPPHDRAGILQRGGEDEWRLAYAPPEEHVVEPELVRAECAIGPLPLALAALFRRVGQVFLWGSFDSWNSSAFLFEDGHDTRRGDLNSDALNVIGVGSGRPWSNTSEPRSSGVGPGLEFEASSFSEVAQLNRGLLPI